MRLVVAYLHIDIFLAFTRLDAYKHIKNGCLFLYWYAAYVCGSNAS